MGRCKVCGAWILEYSTASLTDEGDAICGECCFKLFGGDR